VPAESTDEDYPMQLQPFELERWQSVWENKVELNISESGVHPL